MPSSLENSFEYCSRLTKAQAGNFYFSFLTLPRPKRQAMCAIYAWMRRIDDLSDDAPSPEEARKSLDAWKLETHAQLEGRGSAGHSDEKLWPAFAETVRLYSIPHSYFDEIAEGTLMDQSINRYETFEQLYQYCYRVASVVGLVCLRVFEFDDPKTEKHGEWLGIAFQLTNILRDVAEDASRGRIYLPLADLKAQGISEQEVLEGKWSPAMHELLKTFAARAEEYYLQAAPVTDLVSREARPTLRIMTDIYHGILVVIKKMDYQVFERRARVPTWKKLSIVARHQLGI